MSSMSWRLKRHTMKPCLHDFRVLRANPEATIEVCRLCHYKAVFRTSPITGDYDVRHYQKTHERDFLQPHQKEFHQAKKQRR